MKKRVAIILALAVLILANCTSLSMPEDVDMSEGGTWAVIETKDEFGFPTGETIMASPVTGEFSNSATTGSELTGAISLSQGMSGTTMTLMLYEYGQYVATFTGANVDFSAATANGERLVSGKAVNNVNSISIYNQNTTKIIDALARGEDVLIAIEGTYLSRYVVHVPALGFGRTLSEYLGG